jgi:hypothetical protein
MKFFKTYFFVCLSFNGFSQIENPISRDTLKTVISKPIEVKDQDFLNQYRKLKPTVVKMYPYALYAADLLDQMSNNLESITKRRAKHKFLKQSYKNLKADFKYVILDMYISEGQVLMKLIARETGTTVYDIIKKYKGRKDAAMFSLIGKLYEQNIKVPYNPQKEYVIEAIIKDIESGKIKMNNKIVTKDKITYKEEKNAAKEQAKKNKARTKAAKKKQRLEKRKKLPKDGVPI